MNTKKRTPIACVGGKSGGHIIPCLTIAYQNYPDNPILFFSTNAPLDHRILSNQHAIKHIPLQFATHTIAIRNPLTLARTLYHSITAIITSFFYFIAQRPCAIISSGGAVAVPLCVAGWILRIPIHIYELNAVPGKAIKFLAPLSTTINVCFPQAQKYFNAKKCMLVAYPLRFTAPNSDLPTLHTQLAIPSHHTVLLILGGSQGSTFLNKTILQWLASNPQLPHPLYVIHQTGAADVELTRTEYKNLHVPAHVFSYHPDMALYYQAADLVICRAGAGTLFELLHFKKSCLVVPLTLTSTSHQTDNAQALAALYPDLITIMDQEQLEKNTNLITVWINRKRC
jgi:UDP-N-acetylglucosamine--N-acetylmuramyl-(pentapeptide) pyrophosphoryl-undecaprenol N-acetylglucosamine transferase